MGRVVEREYLKGLSTLSDVHKLAKRLIDDPVVSWVKFFGAISLLIWFRGDEKRPEFKPLFNNN